MRFFFKSYLRGRSPADKGKPKRNSFSKATRDASEEVKRELDSLDRAAEDGISSAIHKSKDTIRGRKINTNGIAKDERHGSLSPANKKFVDNVNRKVNQRLQEIGEGTEATVTKAKGFAKDVADKAGEVLENAERKATQEAGKTKQQAESSPQQQSEKSDEPQTASKKDKKSKLPQKKKGRKETEESGVLVQREDAEEDVQAPEKEPEPKDVNNTLSKNEGKGLF
jgi:hypothetical protein